MRKFPHWSDQEREEWRDLLADVCAATKNSGERKRLYASGLRDALQAQRPWAQDVDDDARMTGYGTQITTFSQAPSRALVSYKGELLNKPLSLGTRQRDERGAVMHQQELIEVWSWDLVEQKIQDYSKRIAAYKADMYLMLRLLDLRDKFPDSANPKDACSRIGKTVEEFLGTENAA